MGTAAQSDIPVSFDNFELKLRTRELYRDGSRLKIRGHPVEVLAILLEHPGELVTRETLRMRLWPNDTFVDFEQILNNSVGKLRDALGDNAESPRFIETLPRLGYRFIASVNSNGANHSEPAPFTAPLDPTVQTVVLAPRSLVLKRRILWMSIGLTCVVSALAYRYMRSPLPTLQITNYEQLTLDGNEKLAVGTDGSRIYLYVRNPQMPIAQISVSGGSLTKIPVDLPHSAGPAIGISDVAHDGSNLLAFGPFTREEGYPIWLVGTAGHPARYLTKTYSIAFSPDGKSIVYANAHGDLLTRGIESDTPRFLFRENAPSDQIVEISDIQWSPDGKRIRFTRRGRGMTIWEIKSDGTDAHEWLPGWNGSARKCCGHWSTDGKFFVFLVGPGAAQGPMVPPLAQIWVNDERRGMLHPNVRDPFPLAMGPLLWGNPIPSSDGKKIFARGVSFRGELERYDRKTNRLEPFLGGISAEMLDFSRDGKYVAYVSFPEGILWRANRDGSGPVQLTGPALYVRNPRWSPDGSKLLFTSNTQNGLDHLYVISSNGGKPERLFPEEAGPISVGDWSPDGKRVVFTTHPSFSFAPRDAKKIETRILDLATGKTTTLPKWSGGFWAPLWSPDGRYIAGHPFDQIGLALFDLNSQSWKLLAPKIALGYHAWSHDGRFLYFMTWVGSKNGVYRVPVQGGKEELIFDFPEGFRGTGWYGLWMNLDPDDVPIVFRNVGTDEIYALTLDQK